MQTSLIGAAIDALVALARTACAPLGVPVYDMVELTGDTSDTYVIVGTSDDESDPWQAASAQQAIGAGFGRMTKNETATIYGMALSWLGNTETQGGMVPAKVARDGALEALAAIEQAMRVNKHLGLQELGLHWANMSVGPVYSVADGRGTSVRIGWQVEYAARLEGITG